MYIWVLEGTFTLCFCFGIFALRSKYCPHFTNGRSETRRERAKCYPQQRWHLKAVLLCLVTYSAKGYQRANFIFRFRDQFRSFKPEHGGMTKWCRLNIDCLFVLIVPDSFSYCTGFGKFKNPWAIPTCHLEGHLGPPAAPWLLFPSPPPADPKWYLHSQCGLQWDPRWACYWCCALHPPPDHLLPTSRWVEWLQLWHGCTSQQATAYQRGGRVSTTVWALFILFPSVYLPTRHYCLTFKMFSLSPSSSQSSFLREGEEANFCLISTLVSNSDFGFKPSNLLLGRTKVVTAR